MARNKPTSNVGAVHDPHGNPPTEGSPTVDTASAIQVLGTQGLVPEVIGAPKVSRFKSLTANADMVEGATLEKNKANLVGVPFVVTNITVRDGVRSKRTNNIQNYVSLELIIADEETLMRMVRLGRLTPDIVAAWVPEESVVINDGSTGICRQVIAYLFNKGAIVVPEGPESGPMEECRWDAYFGTWGYAIPPKDDTAPSFDVVLHAPRGLRASEYESDYNPDGATTYYFG